jgi:hypothetical protein
MDQSCNADASSESATIVDLSLSQIYRMERALNPSSELKRVLFGDFRASLRKMASELRNEDAITYPGRLFDKPVFASKTDPFCPDIVIIINNLSHNHLSNPIGDSHMQILSTVLLEIQNAGLSFELLITNHPLGGLGNPKGDPGFTHIQQVRLLCTQFAEAGIELRSSRVTLFIDEANSSQCLRDYAKSLSSYILAISTTSTKIILGGSVSGSTVASEMVRSGLLRARVCYGLIYTSNYVTNEWDIPGIRLIGKLRSIDKSAAELVMPAQYDISVPPISLVSHAFRSLPQVPCSRKRLCAAIVVIHSNLEVSCPLKDIIQILREIPPEMQVDIHLFGYAGSRYLDLIRTSRSKLILYHKTYEPALSLELRVISACYSFPIFLNLHQGGAVGAQTALVSGFLPIALEPFDGEGLFPAQCIAYSRAHVQSLIHRHLCDSPARLHDEMDKVRASYIAMVERNLCDLRALLSI